jgi:hypothetical protein
MDEWMDEYNLVVSYKLKFNLINLNFVQINKLYISPSKIFL